MYNMVDVVAANRKYGTRPFLCGPSGQIRANKIKGSLIDLSIILCLERV